MVIGKGREGSGWAVGAECGGHRLRHPQEAGWAAQAGGWGQMCVQALLCGPTVTAPIPLDQDLRHSPLEACSVLLLVRQFLEQGL